MKSKLLDEEYDDVEMDEIMVIDGSSSTDKSGMGKIPIDVGKDITVLVGTQIKFTCRLMTNKDGFKITWLKDNK